MNDKGTIVHLLDYTEKIPKKDVNPMYPKKISYLFPVEKYNDWNSDGNIKLIHDFKEAAMNCGVILMVKACNCSGYKGFKRVIDFYCVRCFLSDKRTRTLFSNSSNLADGANTQFDKNYKRISVQPHGKQLPRKTRGNLPKT